MSSLDLFRAMKLTEERSGHIICFSGKYVAQWFGPKEVGNASWYMGRGRPADFPPELDIWIWGGISLATERILWKEELYRYLNLLPLFLCLVLGEPLYRSNGSLAAGVFALLALGLFGCVFLWRVKRIQKLVKEVLEPKLNPLGFAIQCHQRPWYSFYIVQRSYSSILPIEDKVQQEAILHLLPSSLTLEDDGSIKLPAIVSVPWDWEGYTRILPGTQFQRMQSFLVDVWTWGALMETARGRTYAAESSSPPLSKMRRQRQIRSVGTVSFYILLMTTVLYMYHHADAPDEWLPSCWSDLLGGFQGFLLGLSLGCLVLAGGCCKPLLMAEPLIGIVHATLDELGPAIEEKTGITMELDEIVNRFDMCGWTYERYCIKMYPPVHQDATVVSYESNSDDDSDDHGMI